MLNKRALERSLELDLSFIKKDAEAKLGWSNEKTQRVEKEYRRFFALCYDHENDMIPTQEIDEFWELHIQDTSAYAQDCSYVLGRFLHHVPNYLEKTPDATEADVNIRIQKTVSMFRSEFNEDLRYPVVAACKSCIPTYDPPKPPPPRSPSLSSYA